MVKNIFEVVLEFFLGLSLFIYSMKALNYSLKTLSLEKIKGILGNITNNKWKALLLGIIVTSIIQSSSATSVILIGFLNVGALKFSQAIPVLFGANIGTTMTAQLIAFRLTSIAPFFIIFGCIFYVVGKKYKNIGLAIFSFGLLFYGLSIMSSAVRPLADEPNILDLFIEFSKNPILSILIGLLATILLQSSSTTIGIILSFVSAGLLDFRASFFIILGENIGTCFTAVLASIGSSINGKRLAISHLLFNIIGTILALIFSSFYLTYIPMLSPMDIPRQIANAHTIFNITNAIIFMLFLKYFEKIIFKIIPKKENEKKEINYLDNLLLKNPLIALKSSTKEIISMIKINNIMIEKLKILLNRFDYKEYEEILVKEDFVDEKKSNITKYLIKISKKDKVGKLNELIPKIFYFVHEIERISDYFSDISNLLKNDFENEKLLDSNIKQEVNKTLDGLYEFHEKIIKKIDFDKITNVKDEKKKINEININILNFRKKLLKEKKENYKLILIINELFTHLFKITEHEKNILDKIDKYSKRKKTIQGQFERFY